MKLSIITVNLNNAQGLQKTISSVISQSFTDFEYLVIDGGSTDGSIEIIKQYQEKITYWISEPDNGIYNAMNKGIVQAKGEYCLFLNSGDGLLHAETLNELFCEKFTEDIVYGNVIKCSKSKEKLNIGIAESNISLYDLVVNRINHQACLIKRELFTDFGLYSEKYSIVSDWKFFIDTIILGNVSVKYIDQNISFFDTEGVSSVNKEKTHEETMQILKSTFPPRVLLDIKELDRYKRSAVIKIYDKLLSNKWVIKLYNFLFHGKSK